MSVHDFPVSPASPAAVPVAAPVRAPAAVDIAARARVSAMLSRWQAGTTMGWPSPAPTAPPRPLPVPWAPSAPAGLPQPLAGTEPRVYTMRELNQSTARVMAEIEASDTPAFITKHGRFIAMITPLASGDVESRVLAAMAQEIEATDQP
jgi:antitoxin (DNA-binding transcriptional repressor) of toxin-antitoxin stability system